MKKVFSNTIVLALSFSMVSSLASAAETKINASQLKKTIEQGMQNIRDLKRVNERFESWNLPSRLGLHYSSQYYLISRWLGRQVPDMDVQVLRRHILEDRLPDGSWYAILDRNLTTITDFDDLKGMTYNDVRAMSVENRKKHGIVSFNEDSVTHYRGDLNASIFHYWALKAMGYSTPAMEDSKNFILAKGGIDASVVFTKTLLALFGNYPWANIPPIPLTLFYKDLQPLVVNQFSQWVIPHIKPMAYMKRNEITKDKGPAFDVSELYLNGKGSKDKPQTAFALFDAVVDTPLIGVADIELERNLIEDVIMREQHPRGSWGGYTLSTLFSIISIDHYLNKISRGIRGFTTIRTDLANLQTYGRQLIENGHDFIETLFFKSPMSNYYGVLDDGSYWDTALLGLALAKNYESPEKLQFAADFLIDKQVKNGPLAGGFPFGYDFETYPDVDDTAEILWFLAHIPGYETEIEKGVRYLLHEQNISDNSQKGKNKNDGGWAAFNKGNYGNALIKMFSKDVGDSADLFDESSADVTGHVLSFLAAYREHSTIRYDYALQRGVDYLRLTRGKATQLKTSQAGAWDSRWAINYLFGTESAVSSLSLLKGFPLKELAATGQWLQSGIQNKDGGFGESSASYYDPKFVGRGISTASQTAWALSTLADLKMVNTEEAKRAVNYLISEMETNKKWIDHSVVGTGHPGIIYMEYPSYPYSFPLIAIAKYLNTACAQSADETKKIFDGGDLSLCETYKNKPKMYFR